TIVMQWILFAAVAFFVFRKALMPKPGMLLDFDWFYRRGGGLFYLVADRSLNGINAGARRVFVDGVAGAVSHFFESGGSRVACWFMTPLWMLHGDDAETIEEKRKILFKRAERGAFPIGITMFCAVILLGALSLILVLQD
ncbi:MAG: hypothetical protein AAGC68_09710, partial [Verrucomicrobiota bacterium]